MLQKVPVCFTTSACAGGIYKECQLLVGSTSSMGAGAFYKECLSWCALQQVLVKVGSTRSASADALYNELPGLLLENNKDIKIMSKYIIFEYQLKELEQLCL